VKQYKQTTYSCEKTRKIFDAVAARIFS